MYVFLFVFLFVVLLLMRVNTCLFVCPYFVCVHTCVHTSCVFIRVSMLCVCSCSHHFVNVDVCVHHFCVCTLVCPCPYFVCAYACMSIICVRVYVRLPMIYVYIYVRVCLYLLLQPPVGFPPAGILPFLDVDAINDTGYRLARISRDDCSFMGPDCVVAKVSAFEHSLSCE